MDDHDVVMYLQHNYNLVYRKNSGRILNHVHQLLANRNGWRKTFFQCGAFYLLESITEERFLMFAYAGLNFLGQRRQTQWE